MKTPVKITISTPRGVVRVARIRAGVPYDEQGREIDLRLFKHNPKILQKDFVDRELKAVQTEKVSL